MKKINQPLTGEFLANHGMVFAGESYRNEICKFNLTEADDHQSWLITIDNWPLDQQTPDPIKTYTEYVRLLHVLAPKAILDVVIGDKKPEEVDQKEVMDKIVSMLDELFSFDPMIGFSVYPDPRRGLNLVPANEYTHTLLNGNEVTFKVKFSHCNEGSEMATTTIEVSTSPEAVCTRHLINLIKQEEEFANEDTIVIHNVWVSTPNGDLPFFGVGVFR